MHFLFDLLRIKGLYMFRAILAHTQEVLHKRYLVYCVRVMSDSASGWFSLHALQNSCIALTQHVLYGHKWNVYTSSIAKKGNNSISCQGLHRAHRKMLQNLPCTHAIVDNGHAW
jgi:hypothetical protein